MNPFEHSRSIAFELSNVCSLAWWHAACPLHATMASPFTRREAVTLPSTIVGECFTALRRHDWRGLIEFHQYNEPLEDPRLFLFVEWARAACPDARVELVTNGLALTAELARELAAQGVAAVHVSLYGNEVERAARAAWLESAIAPLIPTHVGRHVLDDRLGIYDRPAVHSTAPCRAPLAELVVTCRGELGLCCFDWKRSATFGDLRQAPLDQLVAGEGVRAVYAHLARGERRLDICQRCDTGRGL